MRISDAMIASAVVQGMARASERLFRAQEQVASGLAFARPSQDPGGAMRAAALRSGVAELSRYQRNCDDALTRLRLGELALANISGSLREARDAALSMSPFDQAANEALADKVREIAAAVVGQASLASEGAYLFAGYQTLAPPLAPNPGGVPPYLYQGDRGHVALPLARGVSVVASLDAAEILNMDGAADPAREDALETLRQLEAALRAGDREAVESALSAVTWHLEHVLALRGQTGARLQHVELARGRLDEGLRTMQTLLSRLQDADITRAVVELRAHEVAYQAAAAAASALHRASLLQYF